MTAYLPSACVAGTGGGGAGTGRTSCGDGHAPRPGHSARGAHCTHQTQTCQSLFICPSLFLPLSLSPPLSLRLSVCLSPPLRPAIFPLPPFLCPSVSSLTLYVTDWDSVDMAVKAAEHPALSDSLLKTWNTSEYNIVCFACRWQICPSPTCRYFL